MIGVIAVAPQVQVQQAAVDHTLMTFSKPAQAQLIQIRQRRDHFERLTGRDVEIIRRLVTDHDINAYTPLQRTIDFAGHGQRQIEVRGTEGQLLLRTGDQFTDHATERVVFTHPQQRADRQAEMADRTGAGVVTGFFQTTAQITDGRAQTARARQ